jgi:hypothetical protein
MANKTTKQTLVTEHEGSTSVIPKITIRHELRPVHYITTTIKLERIQWKSVTL